MLFELKNLQRRYQGKVVLDIPSLEIEAGRIYTLIGPNGAGKTTLLNLLAFLDEPSRGDLFFHGKRVVFASKKLLSMRRQVVLLDQYPILFTGPVWKNVEYGMKVRGVPANQRHPRVIEMLDLVGMQDFYHADAHSLSGGETKRIALARALALRPEVLLCDEPGANVDKENQEIILGILGTINETEQTSVIFSTHYLSQGRSLADHTLMLEHGTLADIIHENIYRALIIERENGRVRCQVAGRQLLSLPEAIVPPGQTAFKLQIDPEDIHISTEKEASPTTNIVTGHVININQDRGRVRIGLSLGLKLYFFLAMKEYLKKPPVIGSKLTVTLPDSCLRCL
jgi:tungstate transport system ATP-binding protein